MRTLIAAVLTAVLACGLTADDKNPENFIPAGPTSFIGHLTRDVVPPSV